MKQHKCFTMVDKELKKHNTQLEVNLLAVNQIFVSTHRIKNLRDGQRAKKVIASHCPFCGENLNASANDNT